MNGRRNQLTIPLGHNDNVSTFDTAPGHGSFHAFCAKIQEENAMKEPKLLANLNVVSNDKDRDRKKLS